MVPSQQQQPWWQPALQAAGSAVQGIQQQLQRLQPPHTKQQHQQQRQEQVALPPQRGSTAGVMGLHTAAAAPSTALTSAPSPAAAAVQRPHSSSGRQVTKEELGRATWTFLHTLAAQFPEHPSRQQQKDARTLMDLLGRIYPCADCASHFQEIVRCADGGPGGGRRGGQSAAAAGTSRVCGRCMVLVFVMCWCPCVAAQASLFRIIWAPCRPVLCGACHHSLSTEPHCLPPLMVSLQLGRSRLW